LSVADKTGVADLARVLDSLGWEIVSSGGTAQFLHDNGIKVLEVSEVTGFPEILGGRVKTLNPRIHGGILARRSVQEDLEELRLHNIAPVDMVVCNLYPFVEAAKRPGVTIEQMIEQIDIGGPSLLRAAAKNYRWATVVCNPERYREIIRELKDTGDVNLGLRQKLAVEVFLHTSSYDAAIASYFGSQWPESRAGFPEELALAYTKVFSLRYGENPHQKAAYYEPVIGENPVSLNLRQIQGKALSYNNINDLDNAFSAVWDLDSTGCVVAKHAAPCGVALGVTPKDAFEQAFQGDPVSAFGGIVAFNCEVDRDCALAMKKVFLEVVVAPSFTKEALLVLKSKKDLRILALAPGGQAGKGAAESKQDFQVKTAMGGILVQEKDSMLPVDEDWRVVSKRQPTPEEMKDLKFAMTVCKHVKSNSIVLASNLQTVGIGGGQPNRVDAVRIAITRAGERAKGSCLASDAFFPFPDSVQAAAKAGVTAIAHPGGSIRDQESIDAADASGLAMVLTGNRHFFH
jgi:phosphoribosylaminoimidazolecarboxamide formyltransferase/IMP cyclohydrolase